MTYNKPEPGQPCLLEIAGRKLELLFTLKVLKQLDHEHHISVLKGEGLGTMMQDPERLAVVLYYGLKTKHADITEDWIEENVDASMLLDMSPMLVRAITGKWFDIESYTASRLPNAERPAEIKSDTTGSPSGPLADTTSGVLM
jgi:hypothetical protein